MYSRIRIQGFRGIKDLEIKNFRQFNLFVGKNNSGKSTLLESFFLLTGASNAILPVKINEFRNYTYTDEHFWELFFNQFNVKSNISITGRLRKPIEHRKLLIKPNMEFISYPDVKSKIPSMEKGDIRRSYSVTSPIMDGLILEYFVRKYPSSEYKKIVTDVIREGKDLRIKTPPKNYRENRRAVLINRNTIPLDIGTRFNNIQIRKQTEKMMEILKRIEPKLKSLVLGLNGFVFCDIGLDRLIPINMLGDGFFRLFSVVSAIFDTPNGIVLIDEIENGLHFTYQGVLWDAIFDVSKVQNVQIFATTHSSECVSSFVSSHSKKFKERDNIRMYRLEKEKEKIESITYDYKLLRTTERRDLEVR